MEVARLRRRRFHRVIVPTTAVVTLLVALVAVRFPRRPTVLPAPGPAPGAKVEERPVELAIDGVRVLVDGAVVDDATAIGASGRVTRLAGLYDALKARRVAAESRDAPPPRAVLRASPAVPAVVVKSVLQTAAFAGLGDVAMAPAP